MATMGQLMWGTGMGVDPYDQNRLSKEETLAQTHKYQPGSATSPIVQRGYEAYNPGLPSAISKDFYNFYSPMYSLFGKELGAATTPGGGIYNPSLEEITDDFLKKYMGKDPEAYRNMPGHLSTVDAAGEPIPIYNYYDEAVKNVTGPEWAGKQAHEFGHLGWEYDKPIDKFKARFGATLGGYEGEEIWNHMHDLMYGDRGTDYLTGRGLMGLPTPVFGGRFGKRIGSTPGGNWTQKGYDKIRGSGLVPWQQGMLMQGPTTAAGQTALRQRPDEVEAQGQAYMDPGRGDVTAPTMTQQQMVQEATRTGGRVNPHEATRAVSRPTGPNLRNRARGGILSLF